MWRRRTSWAGSARLPPSTVSTVFKWNRRWWIEMERKFLGMRRSRSRPSCSQGAEHHDMVVRFRCKEFRRHNPTRVIAPIDNFCPTGYYTPISYYSHSDPYGPYSVQVYTPPLTPAPEALPFFFPLPISVTYSPPFMILPYHDPYGPTAIQVYSPYTPPVVEMRRIRNDIGVGQDTNIPMTYHGIEATPFHNHSIFSSLPTPSVDFGAVSPHYVVCPVLGLLLLVTFGVYALFRALNQLRHRVPVSDSSECEEEYHSTSSSDEISSLEDSLLKRREFTINHSPSSGVSATIKFTPSKRWSRTASLKESKINIPSSSSLPLTEECMQRPAHAYPYQLMHSALPTPSSNLSNPLPFMFCSMLGLLIAALLLILTLGVSAMICAISRRRYHARGASESYGNSTSGVVKERLGDEGSDRVDKNWREIEELEDRFPTKFEELVMLKNEIHNLKGRVAARDKQIVALKEKLASSPSLEYYQQRERELKTRYEAADLCLRKMEYKMNKLSDYRDQLSTSYTHCLLNYSRLLTEYDEKFGPHKKMHSRNASDQLFEAKQDLKMRMIRSQESIQNTLRECQKVDSEMDNMALEMEEPTRKYYDLKSARYGLSDYKINISMERYELEKFTVDYEEMVAECDRKESEVAMREVEVSEMIRRIEKLAFGI